MNIVTFLELVAVLFIALVGITQVIVPLFRGRPPFPFFGGKGKLESDLDQAKEEVDEAKIKREIGETKKKAARISGEDGPKN